MSRPILHAAIKLELGLTEPQAQVTFVDWTAAIPQVGLANIATQFALDDNG
jgi:hypothetical protein